MSRGAVLMAGASPHRSRQNMQRTTRAGAILIQHVTKSSFDPTYELLARQRQTVMLRHVKPTRPGQHQQDQRTRPPSISGIRRGLFFLWTSKKSLTQKDRNLKTGPFGNGVLSSCSCGMEEKNRHSYPHPPPPITRKLTL